MQQNNTITIGNSNHSFLRLFMVVIVVILLVVYFLVNDLAMTLSILGAIGFVFVFFRVCWRLYQTGFDLFSPVNIFGGFLLLAYPIKSLYILYTLSYGPFVTLNYKFILDEQHMLYFGAALALSSFCCILFLQIINVHWAKQTLNRPLLSIRVWSLQKMLLLMVGISLIITVLFSWLITEAGGLKFYLQSVAGRQSFFYGRYYIYILIDLFPEVSCFYLACQIERRNHYPAVFLLALITIITLMNLLVAVLAGNRSTFLIGFAIPMMVFWHYRVNAIKIMQAVFMSGLILFISLFYISTFRGGDIAGKLSLDNMQQSLFSSLSNISSSILGGPDLVQFDMLMVTMREIPSTHQYFNGDSIKAVLAFPIPRALYPDKPVRGNWLFTDAVFPSWRVNLSGFTVSYLGDWYMNFGIVGAIIGMVLLGFGLRTLLLSLNPKTSWVSAVFYGLALSGILTIFRSDIFAIVNFGISLVFAVMIVTFCSSRKHTHD